MKGIDAEHLKDFLRKYQIGLRLPRQYEKDEVIDFVIDEIDRMGKMDITRCGSCRHWKNERVCERFDWKATAKDGCTFGEETN